MTADDVAARAGRADRRRSSRSRRRFARSRSTAGARTRGSAAGEEVVLAAAPGDRLPARAAGARPARADCSTSTSRSTARPARTSGRSPATSAPRSASAATSPRCGAPGSGRSRWPTRSTLAELAERPDPVPIAAGRGGRRRVPAARRWPRPRPPGSGTAAGSARSARRAARRVRPGRARGRAGRGARRRGPPARRLPPAPLTAAAGRSRGAVPAAGLGSASGRRGACCAGGARQHALGLGPLRRDHRRLRRRPPRPPGDHRPGAWSGPAPRLPLVVLTFDPHPSEVVRPGIHPPMLTPVDARPSCSRSSASTRRACSRSPRAQPAAARGVRHVCSSSGCTRPRSSSARTSASVTRPRAMSRCSVARRRAFGFSTEGVAAACATTTRRWSSTYVRVQHRRRRRRARPPRRSAGRTGSTASSSTATAAAASSASRPPTSTPTGSRDPADGVYAGLGRAGDAASGCRRRSRSAPTRLRRRQRRSRRTCWTATTDLYGVELGVEFVERLRGMVKFDSIEALVEQIGRDVEQARDLCA